MKGNWGKGGKGGDNHDGGAATEAAQGQFRPPPAQAHCVRSGGAELGLPWLAFDPRGSRGGGDAGLVLSVALGPDALAPASRSRRGPETFIMRTARGTACSDLSPNPRFQDPAQFSCTQVAPGASCRSPPHPPCPRAQPLLLPGCQPAGPDPCSTGSLPVKMNPQAVLRVLLLIPLVISGHACIACTVYQVGVKSFDLHHLTLSL